MTADIEVLPALIAPAQTITASQCKFLRVPVSLLFLLGPSADTCRLVLISHWHCSFCYVPKASFLDFPRYREGGVGYATMISHTVPWKGGQCLRLGGTHRRCSSN